MNFCSVRCSLKLSGCYRGKNSHGTVHSVSTSQSSSGVRRSSTGVCEVCGMRTSSALYIVIDTCIDKHLTGRAKQLCEPPVVRDIRCILVYSDK